MINHVIIYEVILRSRLVEDYIDLQGLETTVIKHHEMSK